MGMFILGAVWFVVGYGVTFATHWSIMKEAKVRDLIMCVIGGLLGPIAIMFYIAFAEKPWLNKRVL